MLPSFISLASAVSQKTQQRPTGIAYFFKIISERSTRVKRPCFGCWSKDTTAAHRDRLFLLQAQVKVQQGQKNGTK